VTNPGAAFRFDVHRGADVTACSGLPDNCGLEGGRCDGEAVRYERNMNLRSGSGATAVGECGCRRTSTSGYNICNNNTEYYFVKVYRPGTTTTCDSYTIRMANNPP
jgi:hypothetical protein